MRYLPGHEPPEAPAGWILHPAPTCLACRRAAVRAAAEVEAAGLPAGQRGYLVADRLAAFELRRDPSRSAAEIAKLAGGVRPARVHAIRRELVEAGEIEPAELAASGRGALAAERRARIEAQLKADPTATNAAIARSLGVDHRTVKRVRAALGIEPGIRPTAGGGHSPRSGLWPQIDAALRAAPLTSNGELARRFGIDQGTIRGRRLRLEADGEIPLTVARGPRREAA